MALLLAIGALGNIYGLDNPLDEEARRAFRLRNDPPETSLDKNCVLKEQSRIAQELNHKISRKFDFDRSWTYTETQDSSTCVLNHLPESVATRTHFFAYLAAGDPELLEHWLMHYERLGILADKGRALIVLDTNATANPDPARQVLTNHHLEWTETVAYSSYKKTAAVNRLLASLPHDALLVYPDADEFFEYPCDLEERLGSNNGVVFMQSAWRDRVASDWSLARVETHAPIAEQFPRVCRLTEYKPPIQATTKFVLVPARDARGYIPQYLNSHLIKCAPPPADASAERASPTGAEAMKGALAVFGADSFWTFSADSLVTCSNAMTVGPHFAHYRFTHSTVALTERKIQMYHERRKDKMAPLTKMDVTDRAQLSLRRYTLDMLMFEHQDDKVYLHPGVRMFCDVDEAHLRVARRTPKSVCTATTWAKRKLRLAHRADGAIDDTDLAFVLQGYLKTLTPGAQTRTLTDLICGLAAILVVLKLRAVLTKWLKGLQIRLHAKRASPKETSV